MRKGYPKYLLYAAIFAIAAAAGLFGSQMLQSSVPLLPGEAGCKRLYSGSARAKCYGEAINKDLSADLRGLTGATYQKHLDFYLHGVDNRAAKDKSLRDICHQAMHVVGRSSGQGFATQGKNLVFPHHSARLCTAGYAHGLVEGYLQQGGAISNLPILFQHMCVTKSAESDCAHGLGHAVMRRLDSTSDSIAKCTSLNAERIDDCANGVYMEVAIRNKPISLTNFASMCSKQAGANLKSDCFFYLPGLANAKGLPIAKTIEACNTYAGDYLADCAEAVGRMQGIESLPTCTKVPASVAQPCMQGALRLALSSKLVTPAQARKRCTTKLPAKYHKDCLALVTEFAE